MRMCSLLAVATLVLTTSWASAATRFHQYTEQYKNPPNPATPGIYGYLGGGGTEWLVGGGFLPDGRIVVVGNAWGPKLDLPGVSVGTIGSGGAAPTPPAVKKNKKGGDVPPSFLDATGAGWLAIIKADGSAIEQAVRLPWQSGTVTAGLVDDAGGIYIAGRVGAAFASAGLDAKAMNWPKSHDAAAPTGFICKFDSRLKPLWARTVQEPCYGSQLRYGDQGTIHLKMANAHVFNPDGSLVNHHKSREGKTWAVGYDPKTFRTADGYFHKHHTGREPWHRPFLTVASEDGSSHTTLFQWHGHLVGHDRYRLVSDSKILNIHFGDDGYLYASGWSDGGNTVFQKQGYDLNKPHGHRGLGFSAWGAGAMSLAHIMKIDPETLETVNYTLWCGFLSGKQAPSSATIKHLSSATSGDLIMAGGASWGLIQTGNKLSDCAPAGSYITIMDKSFEKMRFSSAIPGAARVTLGHKRQWSSNAQVVQGRHKVLVTTSAVDKVNIYESQDVSSPISGTAPQRKFGGGRTDGWFMVVDLGAK